MPEIHLVFSDTGTDRLPGWVERFLRAAGGEDETPMSTLEGVQKIDRDLQTLKGLMMGQFEDLQAQTAAVSQEAAELAVAVADVAARVAALPGVPPDISAQLAELGASAASLDASTTALNDVAVATPPPVEPPVEPPPA